MNVNVNVLMVLRSVSTQVDCDACTHALRRIHVSGHFFTLTGLVLLLTSYLPNLLSQADQARRVLVRVARSGVRVAGSTKKVTDRSVKKNRQNDSK